jgi:signal peptidase I
MGGFAKFIVFVVLALAGLLAGLRATCLDFWTVPSDDPLYSASVVPTLEQGDLVVLWRRGAPTYADLVRCTDPGVPGRYVIGRILGEPGDRISGVWHSIYVNKRILSSAHACTTAQYTVPHPVTGDPVDLICESEESGGNDYTRVRFAITPATNPETFETVVPNDHFFLVSDNRAFHYDSRTFGPVVKSSCPERIMFRLWSARGWADSARRLTMIH